MDRPHVSIKDIARAAGVSHSTVSRALRGSPLVSPETRERIQRLARKMHYTPNAVAQSLQTRRTNTIGLVVTSIGDPFFVDVVKGVEEVAQQAGLSVFLNSSHNDPEREIQVVETFHRRRVDGIVVASSRVGSRYADDLARIRVPVVLVNSQAEADYEFLHLVAVDDQTGARLAVEHLLHLGHTRIGYIGVTNRPKSNRRRLAGYREALARAGVTAREEWVAIARLDRVQHEGDVEVGQRLGPRLLARGVTALFCYNDMVAIGALLGCRARGIAVPEECSVLGFDDIELTRYVTPPLTTVHQPKREMGRLAMQMLLDLLAGRPVRDRILAPSLVLRASTAPPRREGVLSSRARA